MPFRLAGNIVAPIYILFVYLVTCVYTQCVIVLLISHSMLVILDFHIIYFTFTFLGSNSPLTSVTRRGRLTFHLFFTLVPMRGSHLSVLNLSSFHLVFQFLKKIPYKSFKIIIHLTNSQMNSKCKVFQYYHQIQFKATLNSIKFFKISFYINLG